MRSTGELADGRGRRHDLAVVLGRGAPALTHLAGMVPIVEPEHVALVGHRPASAQMSRPSSPSRPAGGQADHGARSPRAVQLLASLRLIGASLADFDADHERTAEHAERIVSALRQAWP